MVRHTPSAEELETAISDVLSKSPAKLSTKEIREQLQNANQDWKVPGERRVAKFVKRNHTPKKQKNSNGIFRLLKGKDQNNNNNTPLESHPGILHQSKSEDSSITTGSEVSAARKVGFRQSVVTKLFSPGGRGRKGKKSGVEKSQTYVVPEEDRPVFRAISEVEESAHYQVDPDDYEILTPVQAARLYTIKPILPSPVKEEKEEDMVNTPVTKNCEEKKLPDKKHVESPIPRKLEDAYVDDNDGKKGTCNCEGCIIL